MKFLLCLLPVFAHAQITVNIQASKSTTKDSIQALGASVTNITQREEKLFGITEKIIENAVQALSGKAPTNVYLRSPTPWNDLYKTYGWEPVKTVIKPQNVRVVNIDTNKVILNKREVTNEESVERHEEVTMTAKVENKVACTWQQTDVIPSEIKYNIDFIGLGNAPRIELNSTFGENVKESKVVAIKSATVKFALKPKAMAEVTLTATKVKVEVEIEYWIMLSGYVATNNEVRLNGHHFWAYNIQKVMEAAHLSNVRKVKQIIQMEFFTDDDVVVS